MTSLHFYRYFLEQNGKKTNYNLVSLLNYVSRLDIKERTIKLGKNWYTLSDNYSPNSNTLIRFFRISKSINHAYTGYLGTRLRHVNDKLYSYASYLLIPLYHLLIAYQPQNSPYTSEVSNYFMSYIDDEYNRNNLKLDISPIVYGLTLNDITPAYSIKDIQVSFKPINYSTNITNSLLGGFNKILNNFNTDNKVPEVSFKINNMHNKSISYALLCNLLNQLRYKNSNIKRLSLRVKGPNDYRYRKVGIDKKNNSKILLPFDINIKNTKKEYLCNKMLDCYENRHIPKEVNYLESGKLKNFINRSDIRFIDNPKNDFYNINKK